MQITWEISADDAARVRDLMARMSDNAFVRHRARNLRPRGPVTLDELWLQMLGARLTTQQRSGPDTPVSRFTRLKPYPLTLAAVRVALEPAALINATLRDFGGIRFADKIGNEMGANLLLLLGSTGEKALSACNALTHPDASRHAEADAAQALMAFHCFGPKQSRNALQSLGITRNEVPIDSRMTRWLNDFGFPVKLNSGVLADPDYYAFVSDGIQKLCSAAGVLPCMLDAAIFAESDGQGWTPENVVD